MMAELYQDIPITITGHNITCNMLLGLDVLMTHGVVIGLNECCLKVKKMELKQGITFGGSILTFVFDLVNFDPLRNFIVSHEAFSRI